MTWLSRDKHGLIRAHFRGQVHSVHCAHPNTRYSEAPKVSNSKQTMIRFFCYLCREKPKCAPIGSCLSLDCTVIQVWARADNVKKKPFSSFLKWKCLICHWLFFVFHLRVADANGKCQVDIVNCHLAREFSLHPSLNSRLLCGHIWQNSIEKII